MILLRAGRYVLLALAAAFVALVIGILIREHFSWARMAAQARAFAAAISSGDPAQTIAALTSTPFMLVILSAAVCAGVAMQRRRGRRAVRKQDL